MRISLLIILALVLSGCGAGSYKSMYSQYISSCSMEQNQNLIEVPTADNKTLKISQGCALTAPVDSDAKWVALGGALGVALVRGTVQIKTSHDNRDIMTEAFRQAGPDIGGDGVIGGRDADMTDQTAEPFIVESPIPPPVVVP
ncbi:MAG: hypothetical protein ACN4GR_07020 [Arenicellales bacterium]